MQPPAPKLDRSVQRRMSRDFFNATSDLYMVLYGRAILSRQETGRGRMLRMGVLRRVTYCPSGLPWQVILAHLGLHLLFDRIGQRNVREIGGILGAVRSIRPFHEVDQLLRLGAILLVHVEQQVGVAGDRIGCSRRCHP